MLKSLSQPLVKKAYQFARLSLAGKKRYSGEEFVEHCLKTAQVLEDLKVTDPTTQAVAILHHTLSDSAATLDDVKKEFGEEIALMTQTLEGLKVIKLTQTSQQQFIENLRKMFLTLAKDLRIVLVKLADIYDNLQTLKYLSKEKQLEVAKETLEIFAPLAERLGMGELKGKMEDLAFEYLHPSEYQTVKRLLGLGVDKLKKSSLKIKSELEWELVKENIDARIDSRVKNLFSLYTKLKRPEINQDIAKIYDLVAFRIIVESVEDCYKVLSLIQKLWSPLSSVPVRDYIAHPKANGYQSIHTTIIGPGGKPVEIQIRTSKMHQEAELGLAAHWQYAEAKTKGLSDQELTRGLKAQADKLYWVKQLNSWQEEVVDNEEFLKSVKTDLFGERIFCFTPKGDVKDLPQGATPIDFAYSVHTDLGDKTIGAKVNGKMVSLDTKLKNGDAVEILVSKDLHKKPSQDWLKFVTTSFAKREIRKTLKAN